MRNSVMEEFYQKESVTWLEIILLEIGSESPPPPQLYSSEINKNLNLFKFIYWFKKALNLSICL